MLEEVLAFHDKFTLCTGAGVPFPVRVAVVVAGWALLVNVSVAMAVPVVEGLNVTVNGDDWPAEIVRGSEIPLTTNAVLFVLAPVMVTLAPVAFKFADAVPLAPTTTSPTAIVPGETPSWALVAVPVPDKAMVSVGFEAFDVSVRAPVALPETVGVKVTLMVAFVPGPRVNGAVIPVSVNALPEIWT
jgi:hypothetical protein